jgi:hypothetical protein
MADEPRRRIGRDPVDRPYPWEPLLETSVFDPTWEKAIKRAIRTMVPSTPRETSNELFLAALGGPLGAGVSAGASKVGRPALNAILKHLNPPFNPTRRRTLETLGGKDTLETMQKRDLLLGDVPKNVYKNLERDPFVPNVEGILNELGDMPWEIRGDPSWHLDQSGMLGRSLDRLSKVTSSADLESSNEIFNRLQREWDIGDRLTETASGRWGILGDLIEHGRILSRKIGEEIAEETGEAIQKESSDSATAKVVDDILKRFNVRRRQ